MFEIDRKTVAKFELLKISGKLVTAEAYKLEDEIDKIISKSAAINFVFDLCKLEYCSSYGLRIFIKAKKDLKMFNGKVIIFTPSKNFMELLEIAGLEDFFIIENDIASVVELLSE